MTDRAALHHQRPKDSMGVAARTAAEEATVRVSNGRLTYLRDQCFNVSSMTGASLRRNPPPTLTAAEVASLCIEVTELREALRQVAYSHEDWVRDLARAALAKEGT